MMDGSLHPTKRKPMVPSRHRGTFVPRKSEKSLSARENPKSADCSARNSLLPVSSQSNKHLNGPSLIDKDHASFVDVDLDFRTIIQEIDSAMQQNIEVKSRLMQTPQKVKSSPRLRPQSPQGTISPKRDELYQFIAHLPNEKEAKKALKIERIQDISVPGRPAPAKPLQSHSSAQTVPFALSISCQTDPPPVVYGSWGYAPIPQVIYQSPSPEPKPKPRPKVIEKPAKSPDRIRESSELSLIRTLLSPEKSKPRAKRGELVVVADSPIASLSEVFEMRRKALFLRMKERASSLPLHQDRAKEHSPQRKTEKKRWVG